MTHRSGFSNSLASMTRFDKHIASEETNKLRNKVKQKRFVRKMFVLNTFKCQCQLYRGDDKFTGRIIELTPSEMGRKNKDFRLSFIKMMDDGKEPVLYSWRIIDRDALQSAIENNVNDIN